MNFAICGCTFSQEIKESPRPESSTTAGVPCPLQFICMYSDKPAAVSSTRCPGIGLNRRSRASPMFWYTNPHTARSATMASSPTIIRRQKGRGMGADVSSVMCRGVKQPSTAAQGESEAFYMTGGTEIPMTPRARISSRRTTETVANRNFFRFSSGSLRMG